MISTKKMTKLSVLILVNLLILVVQGQKAKLLTPEEGCGKTDKIIKPRIVGGVTAKNGAFPWMALIGYSNGLFNDLFGYSFNCGGSLVSSKHVLTAAHCINEKLKIVRLGEHDLTTNSDGPTQDIKVVKIDTHEKYDQQTITNDIALLTLEKEVQFSDRVRPICLPKDEPIRSKSFVGYDTFVAGWGRTAETGRGASILQQLQISVLPISDCQQRYSSVRGDKTQICAGNLKGGEDSCQGDSGGPLMVPLLANGTFPVYQIGLVSFGRGCARKNLPGVYTNVPQYMDWIKSKMN